MTKQKYLKLPFEEECNIYGCYLQAEEMSHIEDDSYDLEKYPLYEFQLVCEEPGIRSSGVYGEVTIRCCGYTFSKRMWPTCDDEEEEQEGSCWECDKMSMTAELSEALDNASQIGYIPCEFEELFDVAYPTEEKVRDEIKGENRQFFLHDGIVCFNEDPSFPRPKFFRRITLEQAVKQIFRNHAFLM